ncbi:MAG TPA: DNA mismatch repair protein MutS, partial [Bacillota bacterium]|nr:DNA mismatch repair protein MutS [Bacillota bacterium]
MALTPMMQQYLDIKKDYTDAILFFRLGDFYEMFFEDALTASKAMEVTLTGKNCGLDERAPMCGVPYHAADIYIAKLLDKGYKVAICEQMEDPATAKGIVKREVVRIITPGTALNQALLNEKENSYLSSVYIDLSGGALAYCDLSTGETGCLEFNKKGFMENLLNELLKLSAKEILIFGEENCREPELLLDLENQSDALVTLLAASYCSRPLAEERIMSQFGVKSLKGIGLSERPMSVMALGALLTYLFETQKQALSHLKRLKISDLNSFMSLDKATVKNLELTETIYDKKFQGSLLGVLDKTRTAMGSRKMKQWLREPLNQVGPICKRLDAVELLVDDVLLRNDMREHLKQIYDLERLIGRVACGNANGRDLVSLRNSVASVPDIKELLKNCGNKLLESLGKDMNDLLEVTSHSFSAVL